MLLAYINGLQTPSTRMNTQNHQPNKRFRNKIAGRIHNISALQCSFLLSERAFAFRVDKFHSHRLKTSLPCSHSNGMVLVSAMAQRLGERAEQIVWAILMALRKFLDLELVLARAPQLVVHIPHGQLGYLVLVMGIEIELSRYSLLVLTTYMIGMTGCFQLAFVMVLTVELAVPGLKTHG